MADAGSPPAAEGGAAEGTDGHTVGVVKVNGVDVVVKTVRPGDATHFPAKGMTTRIHYEAKLLETGEVFDSSKAREQPLTFKLGSTEKQLIAGLDAAILTMSRGQIALITVPPAAAYGEHGYLPIIPPAATLEYEVELIAFADMQ